MLLRILNQAVGRIGDHGLDAREPARHQKTVEEPLLGSGLARSENQQRLVDIGGEKRRIGQANNVFRADIGGKDGCPDYKPSQISSRKEVIIGCIFAFEA